MSEWTRALLRSDTSQRARFVGLVLEDMYPQLERAVADPTVAEIAAATQLKARTVYAALQELREHNLLAGMQLQEQQPASNVEVVQLFADAEPKRATRSHSRQEDIAHEMIATRIAPVIKHTPGYNATVEFARAWREGWAQCENEDLNPVHFGTSLAGAYFELLGVEPQYPKIAKLVGMRGAFTLKGIEAALAHIHDDSEDWYPYALTVATNEQRRAQARREAKQQ